MKRVFSHTKKLFSVHKNSHDFYLAAVGVAVYADDLRTV